MATRADLDGREGGREGKGKRRERKTRGGLKVAGRRHGILLSHIRNTIDIPVIWVRTLSVIWRP